MSQKRSDHITEVSKVIPAIKSLQPKEQKQIAEQVHGLMVSYYSGPIPSAEQLERYNQTLPEGAHRILRMAEEQSAHRIRIESIVITSQQKQSERGQLIACVLVVILILTGGFLTYSGHDTVGGIIFGTTIIGVIANFIFAKNRQTKDLENKK